jgi:hypothetical protein
VAERLYRSMTTSGDGLPEAGPTARTLGARREVDILVAGDGMVVGGGGGMSVAPDSAMNLPAHRRPPDYGGTGKDPIWELDVVELGSELVYREDPLMPGIHGFIEPARRMAFDDYQDALSRTRGAWRLPSTDDGNY